MKRVTILSMMFVLFTFFAAVAQPKIEIIGGDTYDWGDIKGKTKLKAKVQIRNAGTELLNITEVKPTCGCTTAPLDKNKLKPGEIATLDITLSIAGRRNKVTKTIRINSNDPNAQTKNLWLKCNVIQDLYISKQYLSFKDLNVGYEKEEKLVIKNTSKETIKLFDFEVDNADMTINLKNEVVLKPGKQVDLIAIVKPKEVGNFRAVLKFKTTNPDNKNVTLQAWGRVKESPIFNQTK